MVKLSSKIKGKYLDKTSTHASSNIHANIYACSNPSAHAISNVHTNIYAHSNPSAHASSNIHTNIYAHSNPNAHANKIDHDSNYLMFDRVVSKFGDVFEMDDGILNMFWA